MLLNMATQLAGLGADICRPRPSLHGRRYPM
jgi:hypothetical protein